MLDFLYLIFISPIEFCMRLVFEYGYELTHSYGLALIGVSLALNTAVLPIYNRAEGWQEEERELKRRMAPKEKMIRRCFKGQERFAMIATLYRQSGYSPFMTLRASIGILLQIPFFLAAYLLLSNMPALDGVSFGPIRNLGAPDGLLAIGDVRVNVLPILMTAINLTSAFFYTHSLSRRDTIQLYGMAALFLVLLYNSPAGLTFYWTLNNIYSLCKNIVQKDWMKRQGWQRAMESLKNGWRRVARAAWGLVARAASFHFPLAVTAGFVGLAALFMLVQGGRGGREVSLSMSAMLGCAFLLAAFIGLSDRRTLSGSLSLLQTLVVLAMITMSAYVLAKYGLVQGRPVKVMVRMLLLGAVFAAFTWREKPLMRLGGVMASEKKALGGLFLPAAALLAFLVLIYIPLLVFRSDPFMFGMGVERFASDRLVHFMAAMLCVILIDVLVRPVRWFFGGLLAVMAMASLVFCFLAAPDVGVMNGFVLQKPEALERWYNGDVDVAVILGVIAVFCACVCARRTKTVKALLCISTLVLAVMSGTYYHAAHAVLARASGHGSAAGAAAEVPGELKDFFTFSRRGKNVVVVMLDMFTGGNMNQLLERYPRLRADLDGFTWYEDVVTGGQVTIYGKPGILGGEMAHPLRLNEHPEKSLEEKITRARGQFLRELQERNFRISLNESDFLDPEALKAHLAETGKATILFGSGLLWAGALKAWEDRHVRIKRIEDFDKFFGMIGLYNVAPLRYKKFLYDDANWRGAVSVAEYDMLFSATALANLGLPLYASVVSDTDENCFIYMLNMLTHAPWALDASGLPVGKGASYESRRHGDFGLSEAHLLTEYVALKGLLEWFAWMKENGVYDNTQIILVSDHDCCDSDEIEKMWGEGAYPPMACLQGLLLVKEYGAHGELAIDRESQMANWDVPVLVRNGLAADEREKRFPWRDAARRRGYVGGGSWMREEHPGNVYDFEFEYLIQGPLLQRESWKRVK